jgi:hypothetical protein
MSQRDPERSCSSVPFDWPELPAHRAASQSGCAPETEAFAKR